jgi:uncharacterized iron-regulated membrane protein
MIGIIALVFGMSAAYCMWRKRAVRLGQPIWPSDRYLYAIMVIILAAGSLLVAVRHL